ncbi:phage tail protein [Selenomonas artemidis]|uniref:phage tail protein n=1 Tax=Selenomonas artemidis TaxID=671224 RepID=UPI0003F51C85|nr:phage tail protein [Selenomonas artemidis]
MSGIFGKTTITSRADKISDFQINSATYGATVPQVLGTTRISGNIIDYTDFTAYEHRHTQRSGKGGGVKSVSIDYTYTVAVAIALCAGPIQGIGKVWRNKEVLNYPGEGLGLSLFDGRNGQEPWSYMKGKHPERALPYSGLAYLAGVVDLGNSGSLPVYNFEVKNPIAGSGDGVDVNPADLLLHILADHNDGVGFNEYSIDLDALDNFRRYCAAADLLFSTPPDDTSRGNVQSIVETICTLTNTYGFWSQNKLKLVPLADGDVGSWKANKDVQYDLTADDFIPQTDGTLVRFERKDNSEAYNQATVEFINRANGYEKETVSFEITSDIAKRGLRAASTLSAPWVYTKARAQLIAQQQALRNLYSRNAYTFKTAWAHCRLEPGDLVTLTDRCLGIDKKVVVIKTVTEAADGGLEFTAIAKPPGIYSPARYETHETTSESIDYNATPGDAHQPLIFQPPADVTTSGSEVWLVTSGGQYWGGATVWVSDDNEKYVAAGKITSGCTYGRLDVRSRVPSTGDGVCVVNLISGRLYPGTVQDAERGNTLGWINGECIAHTGAELIGKDLYSLTGLHRGMYGTLETSHSPTEYYVRLDDSVFKHTINARDVGKKIYVKLTSYNIFGLQEQALDEVTAHEYTISSAYVPAVSQLAAVTRYRQLADARTGYDVIISWTPPEISSYAGADVYARVKPAGETAFSAWDFVMRGDRQATINQARIGDEWQIKVVAVDAYNNRAAIATETTVHVVGKNVVPNTPQNFSISFGNEAVARWDDDFTSDVAFYELRFDEFAGTANSNLLLKTTSTSATIPLTERTGTVYLFACNAIGKYSAAAACEYNVPAPVKPAAPQVHKLLGGFGVVASPLPPRAKAMKLYINTESYVLPVNTFTFTGDAGAYEVAVAYLDMFGEGAKSDVVMTTVSTTIPPEWLKNIKIGIEQVDETIKDALDKGKTAAESYTNIVKKVDGAYTAIAQLGDDINLRVKKGDVINQINLSPDGVQIDGKFLHVTGDTKFERGVIAKNIEAGSIQGDRIVANSIGADRLQVDELSAITAKIGTLRTADSGARTEIHDNLILVYDDKDRLRVRMGVW